MNQTALVSVQTKLASGPDYNFLFMIFWENQLLFSSGRPAARLGVGEN